MKTEITKENTQQEPFRISHFDIALILANEINKETNDMDDIDEILKKTKQILLLNNV